VTTGVAGFVHSIIAMTRCAWFFVASVACTSDVPVQVIADGPTLTPTATVTGSGGIKAARLERHVGLAVGFNDRRLGDGWSLENPGRFDAGLADLAPGVVRFPGGTIAQVYDWDGGTGVAAGSINMGGTSCPIVPIDPTRSSYQNFVPVTRVNESKTDTLDTLVSELPPGTGVDFNLNVLMRTADNQLQMLQTAHSKGLAIDRVELGNEFYYDGKSGLCDVFANAFPTGRHYAQFANNWARQIAAKYPDAKISVVANERFRLDCDTNDGHERCWNHDLFENGLDSTVDALAIHPYVWPTGACKNGKDMFDDAHSLIGAGVQMAAALMEQGRSPTQTDDSHGTLGYSLASWQKPIWITEYGYFNYTADGKIDWTNKWAGAIATLVYAIKLTNDSRVSVMLHHNITDMMWGPGPKQGLKARGIAMKQLDLAVAAAQPTANADLWYLDFSGTNVQYQPYAACGYDHTAGPFQYDAVVGRLFTHDYDTNRFHGASGLIANAGAQPITLDLAGLYTAAGATAEIWSADPMDEPDDAVSPATHTSVMLDGANHEVQVPAYGIVRWHDRS
jgi:hypothetical protein